MGCDSDKSLEKHDGFNGFTASHQSSSLNVRSENSVVQIGDRYNFSKNVLIVVPDNPCCETPQSEIRKEKKRCKDSLQDKVLHGKFDCTKSKLTY